MAVQAKVRCIGNTPPQWEAQQDAAGIPIADDSRSRLVRFTPVYGTEGDNSEWSRYTPAGYFEMSVTNAAAFEQFEVNAEYLVTFKRAE